MNWSYSNHPRHHPKWTTKRRGFKKKIEFRELLHDIRQSNIHVNEILEGEKTENGIEKNKEVNNSPSLMQEIYRYKILNEYQVK